MHTVIDMLRYFLEGFGGYVRAIATRATFATPLVISAVLIALHLIFWIVVAWVNNVAAFLAMLVSFYSFFVCVRLYIEYARAFLFGRTDYLPTHIESGGPLAVIDGCGHCSERWTVAAWSKWVRGDSNCSKCGKDIFQSGTSTMLTIKEVVDDLEEEVVVI